jgi:isopentenyl diphosphate isomerase/L-lactate dehydrogenase-like FMN-dependent dehydrogenase
MMKEIRNQARKRMDGFCRVCPICDGRVCAGEVPGMGGIGTGAAFRDNVQALSERWFHMRVIHDVVEPDTRTEILGIPMEIPVLAAPIGGVSFNMGGKISEADYIAAKLAGCREKGIIGCTGDGAPAFIHEAGFQAIGSLEGHGIPFVKPWEDKELYAKLEGAAATGAKAVGMDIDAAGLITLKLMGRPVSPKTPEKLKEIISTTPMKFILKGIMTPDQARIAVDAGANAIVVSNHGGRVLDHTPGVARVLSEVAAAVKGQIAILADGGVRTGGDVLKMLALGADAVMIGRPFSVAVMGGLKKGVVRYIDQIRSELIQAMILTGSQHVGAVDPSILWMKP